MVSQFVRNLMGETRKRAIGSLMTYIEREVYPSLNERQQKDLRQRVLACITQYHEVTLDVLRSSINDGAAVNEDALVILTRMEGKLTALGREDKR